MTSMLAGKEFKSIPIRRGKGTPGRVLFLLRMVVDLKLLVCARCLVPHLAAVHGSVLEHLANRLGFLAYGVLAQKAA